MSKLETLLKLKDKHEFNWYIYQMGSLLHLPTSAIEQAFELRMFIKEQKQRIGFSYICIDAACIYAACKTDTETVVSLRELATVTWNCTVKDIGRCYKKLMKDIWKPKVVKASTCSLTSDYVYRLCPKLGITDYKRIAHMKRCIDYIQQQMENNLAKRFNILSVIVAVIAYFNPRIKKKHDMYSNTYIYCYTKKLFTRN